VPLAILIIGSIIIVFGAVVAVGPPYVPTLNKQITTALDMLDLKKGQTLLELGSGDGRVMKAAAERGLKVVGVELNPFLVIISRLRCWRYRKQVTVIWDDLWKARWPKADGIFTFMLQRQMGRLDRKIVHWQSRPVKLASFAFHIPDRAPKAKYNGIFLYEYKHGQAMQPAPQPRKKRVEDYLPDEVKV
jgi:SAM-dependent methyltransferase